MGFAKPMDPAAIREQVDRILHSQSFASKSQLRKLLEVLFANMDSQSTLKPERVIKELWPEEIRTKRSTDVATEMNRLRHALESYYNSEGKNDPITICLPNRAAPASDGRQEKRWIAAKLRGDSEDHSTGPAPSPQVNPRRRLKIVAPIAALSILGMAAYLSIRMLTADNQPQSGRVDGTTLMILNAEGKELWRKTFPDGFWRGFGGQSGDEQPMVPHLWFGDLDGDSHSSVLLLYHPSVDPRSHSSTLICYSDRGKEKWRWTPGRKLPELEGTPATFMTSGFAVMTTPDKKHPRIVVSSHHDPFYPHQIAILDSNGKTLSEYWHSGHLFHLALADLDGDGREEIIATGISSGYRQATVVVLDPDRVFGASTEVARPEVQLHGLGVAQERIRLLFPRSDLNKILYLYNGVQETTIEHGRIRFSVSERVIPPGLSILYEFDRNFHLLSAQAADDFLAAHKEFYLERKVDHPFTPAEEVEFQKVRCLVGCKSEFVPNDIH
jgi:hypothetical protein